MQKLFFLLGAVALLGATVYLLNNKSEVEHTSHRIMKEFMKFKHVYGKDYPTFEEHSYRLSIFTINFHMIEAHNTQSPVPEFTMAVNQFADLTSEEFVAINLGYKGQESSAPEVTAVSDNLPTSVNWVTAGAVSPVQNQGQCGGCWSFSAAGAMNTLPAVFQNGNWTQLSEQQLIDCSWPEGNEGCNGGWMIQAFNYVIKNGITTLAAYPYTGKDGTCKTQGGAFHISSYTNVTANNCTNLQQAVAQQPTSVAVDAQTWQFYNSGIFGLCGKSLDHGVLAVGYQSGSYWLVKNSWGTTWGQKGYIQLKWGNTCGICSDASYPNLN